MLLAATNTVSAEFKARVLKYRNQGELAASVGLHGSGLSAYINGQKFGPHVREKLVKIAAGLGLTEDEAIARADEVLPTLSTLAQLHALDGPQAAALWTSCVVAMLRSFLDRPSMVDSRDARGVIAAFVDFADARLPTKRLANGQDMLVDRAHFALRGALWSGLQHAAMHIDRHEFTSRVSQSLAAAARHAAKAGGAK